MAGFLGAAARLAASAGGRRLVKEVGRYAADPQRRQQAIDTAKRIRQRIADPDDDGSGPAGPSKPTDPSSPADPSGSSGQSSPTDPSDDSGRHGNEPR